MLYTILTIHHGKKIARFLYRRIDYTPPLCMLALSKNGKGAYTWGPNISV